MLHLQQENNTHISPQFKSAFTLHPFTFSVLKLCPLKMCNGKMEHENWIK